MFLYLCFASTKLEPKKKGMFKRVLNHFEAFSKQVLILETKKIIS